MKRVLIVDDQQNVLDGLRRMLHSERSVWEMEFVSSGDAALRACEAHPFDVVVSDLQMPGMDGAQLLEHIRDWYPATARIVLSGYSDDALAARAVPVAYRVLGKPCDIAELKGAIDRVCTLQDILRRPDMQKVIGAIGVLPSLPSSYMALSNALQNRDSTTQQLSRIIEQDSAMTAKVLQIVNSGFFGFSQNVRSLDHAVNYLGIERIKNLALYSHAFSVFIPSREIPGNFYEGMQRHCQITALIAGTLPLSRDVRETTIVAVLLHDLGKLALASKMPKQLALVLEEMKNNSSGETDAEEFILGIGHAEIGAYLLGLWGIDGLVVDAIAHHHHPTRISHH